MTILRKGLLLIAIPLACQIAFVLVLLRVVDDAGHAERLSLHSKAVLQTTEEAYADLLRSQGASRGYVISAEAGFADEQRRASADAHERFEKLVQMVADNPPQVARARRAADRAADLLTWHDQQTRFVADGDQSAAQERVKSHQGLNKLAAVRAALDEFLTEESRLDKERTVVLAETRKSLQWTLGMAVIATTLVTVFAAFVYSRSVSARLRVATVNAERLADGRPLEARVGGRDEVARLDEAIHESSRRLRDADAAEAKLREEVERRAAELARTNESLRQQTQENEMFVYSVSHDLRSPLVNLQGFSKELGHACRELERILSGPGVPESVRAAAATVMAEDVNESLRFIQTAVSRSGAIIDALLRLSRAGRVEYRLQSVDVAEVARRVVDAMRGTIQQRQATVVVHELLPAWGDPTAVEQILGNLVGNAVNYLAPDRPGRVEVGMADDSRPAAPPAVGPGSRGGGGGDDRPMRTYYVRDNGLGIPAAYIHKVFVAFQRLHGSVAPGEGIGLALVRRMVERHGGRAWVESEEGKGTTFYVALPAEAPPADPAPADAEGATAAGSAVGPATPAAV